MRTHEPFSYLRKNIRERSGIRLLFIILCLIFEFFDLYFLFTWQISFFVATLLMTAILLIVYFGNQNERIYDNFVKGLYGELTVDAVIRNLPTTFHHIPDVKLPGMHGNIDAVVIAPSGIYAVEVKSGTGTIGWDGRGLTRNGKPFEKDPLKQAKFNALALSRFLQEKFGKKIFVQPIIVFSSARAQLRFGLKPVDGTYIIGTPLLKDLLLDTRIKRRCTDALMFDAWDAVWRESRRG